MQIIPQSVKMHWHTPDPVGTVAARARRCYKSEANKPADEMVRQLVRNGHTAMLEHAVFSFEVITDIGISREQMRHRMASYDEMSTRYVDFTKKIGIRFIKPSFKTSEAYDTWQEAMAMSEAAYNRLIDLGEKPQWARSVLPLSTVTEYDITINARSLRNFFMLRTALTAHPQMQEMAFEMFRLAMEVAAPMFEDIIPGKTPPVLNAQDMIRITDALQALEESGSVDGEMRKELQTIKQSLRIKGA